MKLCMHCHWLLKGGGCSYGIDLKPDYVWGGLLVPNGTAVAIAQEVRSDESKCGPDAKWFKKAE